MKNNNWMIYGANGYTGALIAAEAKRRGLKPILAGRSDSVKTLADSLGLMARKFDLSNGEIIKAELASVGLVVNCAGPFSRTSEALLASCIETKTNYTDITGELEVFEYVFQNDRKLRDAGITAISGTGFDVVPTDCVAAMLKNDLPTATHLSLAFKSYGGMSRGTKNTAIEGMGEGAAIRKNGKIISVPLGAKNIKIKFDKEPENAMQFRWGDISTAYYSTGIPNIEIFLATPKSAKYIIKFAAGLSKFSWMQSLMKAYVAKQPAGPSPEERKTGSTIVWGEARDEKNVVQRRLRTSHGYQLTIDASLAVVERFLSGPIKPGALTPSLAFGADFVLSLPGVKAL